MSIVGEKPQLMSRAERRKLIEKPLPQVRRIGATIRYGGGRGNQRLMDQFQDGYRRLTWRHAPHHAIQDDTKGDVGR